MATRYISNRRQLLRQMKLEILGLLHIIGSTVSSSILQEQDKKIYKHAVPSKYKYTRTHFLSKHTGYKIKTGKGVAVIFSTVKYAQYLEKLKGKRWNTHLEEVDLDANLRTFKIPTGRPYANFIPGIIKGIRQVKKKVKGIKWKV